MGIPSNKKKKTAGRHRYGKYALLRHIDKTSSLVKQALLTNKHTPGCAHVQISSPPLSYWLPVF